MKFAILFFIILLLIIPFFVSALGIDDAFGGLAITGSAAGAGNTDISVFVGNIIRALLGLLGILILIFILYGGFLWLTSGGNEQMVKKAKDILTSAFLGLIIVLAAYAITTFVVRGITGAISGSGPSSVVSSCYDADINPLPSGTSCEMGSDTPGCCDEEGACRECP